MLNEESSLKVKIYTYDTMKLIDMYIDKKSETDSISKEILEGFNFSLSCNLVNAFIFSSEPKESRREKLDYFMKFLYQSFLELQTHHEKEKE
jgi:hypothetical protein